MKLHPFSLQMFDLSTVTRAELDSAHQACVDALQCPYTDVYSYGRIAAEMRAIRLEIEARTETARCEHGVGSRGFDNGIPCDCDPCKNSRTEGR